ncbi:MAG: PA2779 family protein [Acidobacteria bacterium]|nr:PA2779 family protein [Acidobacteriota bacterium]
MRTIRTLLVTTLVSMLAVTPSVFAQERHAVNPSALAQTVTDQVAKQDADRATIHEALSRPEVRELAAKSGVNLDRMQASIDTLSGPQLAQVASAAQQVNQAFVGGASTVVISTTTIIIALLVVILIVVAAN